MKTRENAEIEAAWNKQSAAMDADYYAAEIAEEKARVKREERNARRRLG